MGSPGRLLVTGGTGLVGAAVAALASEQGWSVLSCGHSTGPVRVDVRNGASLSKAMREHGATAVVHCAYSKADPTVTVEGSAAVAQVCAALGVRLVHLSSDVVFAGVAGVRYQPWGRPGPVSDYGRQKLAAEHAVADSGADAAWVRTSLVLRAAPPGPVERAALDPGSTFFVDETRRPLDVDDLARVVLWLLGSDDRGPIHAVGPDLVSRADLARRMVARAGGDPWSVATSASPDGDRPRHLDLAVSSGVPPIRGLVDLGLPRPAARP